MVSPEFRRIYDKLHNIRGTRKKAINTLHKMIMPKKKEVIEEIIVELNHKHGFKMKYFFDIYQSYKIYRRVKVVKPRTEESFSSEEESIKIKLKQQKKLI